VHQIKASETLSHRDIGL